ncbi:ABC transporter [Arthrobacter sp. ERGS1:01]|uniref:dipeptide/oligopeptide/nickel ABC transporter permease/ATP-binding protein n=1 Tax=Arthrobacter sp. ERGS1:01 TaxID=1704044 RepID=UPI0006B472E5|nr:dipeptide/oligopeptide/nickel ABC transporter permease/ATP-binding protein [Arthrobacter sp. ERGS1:01]ALE05771.1 ABC transporter [Arthrobacter sp. ERGS1:01]
MSVENLTTPTATPTIDEAGTHKKSALRLILKNPVGLASAIVLLAIVLFGIAGPFLAPFNPGFTDLAQTNAPPFSGSFILGGDASGRDILSRLMFATGSTLVAATVVLVVSLVLGATTGLIAGYYSGWFDAISSWVANVILALPGFALLIALYAVIGPNIMVAMAVFGVLIAPSYFRLIRSLVVNVRNELYVDAAKVSGLSDFRIVSRHVLRAVRAPIIIQSSFVLGAGIGIQAGLEFLGLGDPTQPSWGGMLREAFTNIYLAGINVLWPALLVTVTILAFALLGNAIRDGLHAAGSRSHVLTPQSLRRIRADYKTAAAAPQSAGPKESAGRDQAPHLSITDLVIGYPTSTDSVTEVVRGVNIDVQQGEIHGLVGESGSGKSQTAFSVLGILPKEALVLRGGVFYQGRNLLSDPLLQKSLRGKKIGYIPQEPMSNLDPTFTIGKQLVYGLRAVKDISRPQAREVLLKLLERVGINDPERTFNSYPHQISGGMAQRVLIAGALAGDPDFIIADEPTTALDVTVQAEVLELLRELQRERQIGMILVTHNLGVVADICDRVSVMQQGRIVESNSAAELFAAPQHEYTRMLLGATLDGSQLRAPLTANQVQGA